MAHFTEDYQREILALSTNRAFMTEYSPLILPDMFDPGYDELAKLILKSWQSSKGKPLSWGQLKQLATRVGVNITKDDLASAESRGDIDGEELLNFARFRLMRDSLADVHVKAERFEWSKIWDLWETMRLTFPGKANTVEDCLKYMGETPVRTNLISTGLPTLDAPLGGGVGPGEIAILMAPPSGGKTSFLVSLASSAVEAGKKVFYATLEVPRAQIEGKMRRRLCGEINVSIPMWKKKVANLKKGASFFIAEHPPGTVTVMDLVQSVPKDVDVLFIDYADHFRTASGGSADEYISIGALYKELKRVAMERKIPVWTATQIGRGDYEKERISLSSAAASIRKVELADQAISINQTREERVPDPETGHSQATLYVAKNRHGEMLVDVPITVDWRTATFMEGKFA